MVRAGLADLRWVLLRGRGQVAGQLVDLTGPRSHASALGAGWPGGLQREGWALLCMVSHAPGGYAASTGQPEGEAASLRRPHVPHVLLFRASHQPRIK